MYIEIVDTKAKTAYLAELDRDPSRNANEAIKAAIAASSEVYRSALIEAYRKL